MIAVTESYLLGIKDGREYLKANPATTLAECEEHAKICAALVKQHAGDMKDFHRGERDFWRGQCERLKDV
jgi:hypothetical protein